IAGSTATLQSAQVTPTGDGSVPEFVQAIYDSDLFRTEPQKQLRGELAEQKPAPLQADFLGDLLLAPTKKLTTIVQDGTLAVGLDVAWGSTGSSSSHIPR